MAQAIDLTERRRYPRYSRKLVVRFKILGGMMPPDVTWRHARVVNMSRGGLILDFKRPLRPGTVLLIDMPESVYGHHREMTAKAVWMRPGAQVGHPVVGCEFVHMTEEQRRRAREAGLRIPRGEAVHQPPDWMVGVEEEKGDRRKDKREDVILKVRVAKTESGETQPWRSAALENVSEGGAQLQSEHAFGKNEIVDIAFPSSWLGPAKTYQAQVMWRKDAETSGRWLYGIAFLVPRSQG